MLRQLAMDATHYCSPIGTGTKFNVDPLPSDCLLVEGVDGARHIWHNASF